MQDKEGNPARLDVSDPLKGAYECDMDMGWFGREPGRFEPVISNTPNMIAMLETMIRDEWEITDVFTNDEGREWSELGYQVPEGYVDQGPFRPKAPSDKAKTGGEKKDANRAVVVKVEMSLDEAKKLKKEGNEKYKDGKYEEVSLHPSPSPLSCLSLVLSSLHCS